MLEAEGNNDLVLLKSYGKHQITSMGLYRGSGSGSNQIMQAGKREKRHSATAKTFSKHILQPTLKNNAKTTVQPPLPDTHTGAFPRLISITSKEHLMLQLR